MNMNQKCVLLSRHLDTESQMLEQLQTICDYFSTLIEQPAGQSPSPIDMNPAEDQLSSFIVNAQSVVESRQKTLEQINQDHDEDSTLSVRQFIQRSPENNRNQLESKRTEIVNRMHAIRTQLAGDSAVVFYSFDFYRRIVNGLVNCIVEEQGYDDGGKSATNNSGKFFQRAC